MTDRLKDEHKNKHTDTKKKLVEKASTKMDIGTVAKMDIWTDKNMKTCTYTRTNKNSDRQRDEQTERQTDEQRLEEVTRYKKSESKRQNSSLVLLDSYYVVMLLVHTSILANKQKSYTIPPPFTFNMLVIFQWDWTGKKIDSKCWVRKVLRKESE